MKTRAMFFTAALAIFLAGCGDEADVQLHAPKSVVAPSERMQFTADVFNVRGRVEYRWAVSSYCGTISWPSTSSYAVETASWTWSSHSSVSWTAPPYAAVCEISVEIRDGWNDSGFDAVQVQVGAVKENLPPVIIGDITSSAPADSVQRDEAVSLYVKAMDPEGNPLRYAWSATKGRIQGSDSGAVWIAPSTPGVYTVAVAVSDPVRATTGISKKFTVQ